MIYAKMAASEGCLGLALSFCCAILCLLVTDLTDLIEQAGKPNGVKKPERIIVALQSNDLDDLRYAKQLLANPGISVKIGNWLGKPVERGFELLPPYWSTKIAEVSKAALFKAMNVAVFTMPGHNEIVNAKPSVGWHTMAAAAAGGLGGFFGLPAMAVELPLSTAIMLRSIADIARSEGENIRDIETRLACMEVFAFGGISRSDDSSESGYYTVRSALARSVSEAAEFVARKGVADKNAPALVRLIVKIAERFGIQVSEKAAAGAIPAIGAAGGAIINTIFINHFQDMARGHFTIRRLERKYDKDLLQTTYQRIALP